MNAPCPQCGRLYTWDGARCRNRYCRLGTDLQPEARRKEPTDAEAVADLTREMPLSRYCVVGDRVLTWFKVTNVQGDRWILRPLLMEDNLLARVAADALLRAGAQSFESVQEATAWAQGAGAAAMMD